MQVTSAEKVEKKEYASADANGPTLICFMHKVSEPALGLFITLEFYASKYDKINKHFVVLTDDHEKTEKMMRRWAQNSFFSNAKMSFSIDGIEGPGDYGLNRNVTATVLVANKNKVVKNFAFQDPNNEDADKILSALAAAAGEEKPSIDELRKEIRAQRDKRRAMSDEDESKPGRQTGTQ